MKLSARARYATRILLELTISAGHGPISASALSQHTGVSVQFVEQILKPLKQHGLTSSVRGAAGGHSLARAAEKITLADIVRAMEGKIRLANCCDEVDPQCARAAICPTRKVWINISKVLEQELASVNLAALAKQGSANVNSLVLQKRPVVTTKLIPNKIDKKTLVKKLPPVFAESSVERPRAMIRKVRILRPVSK